jgi:hypothetical protein
VSALPQAAFNHDYGCVHKDVPEYDHLIRVLPRCFTEVGMGQGCGLCCRQRAMQRPHHTPTCQAMLV